MDYLYNPICLKKNFKYRKLFFYISYQKIYLGD